MLQIRDIRKQYVTGDLVQTALDGVNLTLRDNEFVAILGPSGSGKTTLLNVIGGLDRYDSGDLIINGISTKKYSDRDWDSYRNHTIGFVFQSYNLIPHQTVLSNVELALTISGISRSERRKRAKKALEDVGLGDQLHKKPNQMSGGQMQRVAIARALVNNPDILLADEPTGALDSDTSVQVMELLKTVSKDRLVVMVTHNPELAHDYANRIVRVRDGKIIDDTNPYVIDDTVLTSPKHKNMGKASMSFFTALALSFNNLRTKKGRTILTAFAGSIGIIGIALIMSLSTGFQLYIDKIQEDTLSNYPLSIQSETADMTSVLAAFGSVMSAGNSSEAGTVVEQQLITQMFAQIGSNDLRSFKTYVEDNFDQIRDDINDIKYSYGIKPLIFSAKTDDGILQVNPGTLFGELTGSSAMSAYMDSDVFYEMIGNTDLLDAQYDVLEGHWPQNTDEMIIVLSDPNHISDYIAYTLGLKNADNLFYMIKQVMEGKEVTNSDVPMQWNYEDLMSLEFRLVNASDKYRYNSEYTVWEDMSNDQKHMKNLVENGLPLKIVGIVCPKEGVSSTTLTPGVAYTSALTRYVIDNASDSPIVQSQLDNAEIDVFTGKPFEESASEDSGLNFKDMISVDEELLSTAFGMDINENEVLAVLENYLNKISNSLNIDTAPAQQAFLDNLSFLSKDMLTEYINEHSDPSTGETTIYLSDAETMIDSYLSGDTATKKLNALERKYDVSADTFRQVYKPLMAAYITSYIAQNMVLPDMPDIPDITLPTIPDTDESTAPTEDTEETEPTLATEGTEETEPSYTPTEDIVTEPTEGGETEPIDDPVVHTESSGDEAETQPPTETIPEIDLSQFYAVINAEQAEQTINEFMENPLITGTAGVLAGKMMESTLRRVLMEKISGVGNVLMSYIGSNFYVNEEQLSSAFQFNMSEEELRRLMEVMSGTQKERSAAANLRSLGYAELGDPTAIAVYFVDFASKEHFLDFLDSYNLAMEEAGLEDQIITYTDLTSIMMSSVRTIIDSVSYVLIAFVAVSLIVSSIMIGIITYISVMERTKEIGVLRAIGASKRNISQVFNAETFIIGLCSGLLGVGITILLNIPINYIIYRLTDNPDIHAQLPMYNAAILVLLSMGLTLLGGLIPSRHAAKKDPVIALRSE